MSIKQPFIPEPIQDHKNPRQTPLRLPIGKRGKLPDKEIYQLYMRGMSGKKIMRYLRDSGLKNPTTGKSYSHAVLNAAWRYMIHNPDACRVDAIAANSAFAKDEVWYHFLIYRAYTYYKLYGIWSEFQSWLHGHDLIELAVVYGYLPATALEHGILLYQSTDIYCAECRTIYCQNDAHKDNYIKAKVYAIASRK
jgi:hypothetical protein